jgi:putative oxidoreductase
MHPRLARACTLLKPVGCAFREIAAIVTRLLMLHVFTPTGWGKLHNLDQVRGFFENLGIPAPGAHALFIGCLECAGGVLLAIGLGTRPIAFLLSCTMVVALLTAHRGDVAAQWPWGTDTENLMSVAPIPLLMGLLWLIGHGPGRLSLDGLIGRFCAKRCDPAAAPA